MLSSVEMLAHNISRRVSLFAKGVFTEEEAASYLLGECAFTLLDNPNSSSMVFEVLAGVPVNLLSAVQSRLARKQLPDGGWEWPPSGGIADPGGCTKFTQADPAEVAAYEALFTWLNHHISRAAM